MPYTIPTAAEFKWRHAKFAAVADATVEALLTEAARTVTTKWLETDYQDGIMYLAAHLMVEEGALNPSASAPSVTGLVTKMKVDEVDVTFDRPGERVSGFLGPTYGSTTYGRRFIELAKRNSYGGGGSVMVV